MLGTRPPSSVTGTRRHPHNHCMDVVQRDSDGPVSGEGKSKGGDDPADAEASGLSSTLPCAHQDELVVGPGHGHVEQPDILLGLARLLLVDDVLRRPPTGRASGSLSTLHKRGHAAVAPDDGSSGA